MGVDTSVLPGNTFKFSQNTDTLIPQIDIDNPVSDPIIARSSADPVLIGSVKTSTGLNAATTDPADPSFSITKEAISCYFYEYFNNELEWSWTGKNSPTSQLVHGLPMSHSSFTTNSPLPRIALKASRSSCAASIGDHLTTRFLRGVN